jgi:hypothetical protein
MELSIPAQFIILSLHPEKGRIIIDHINFRYALTGSVLMDFLDKEEISLRNNRLIPDFRKNGDPVHDMFAEKIQGSLKPKRISYWVRSLTRKRRYVFRETIAPLINKGVLSHERRLFLNIFPYNRYLLTDKRLRSRIIDEIREILLHDKPSTRKQSLLIGLIKASRSYRLLAKEKAERSILRKKCNDFLQ